MQDQAAVFFDLDGVVIDSAPLIVALALDVLEARGLSADPRLLDGFVGPPLEDSFSTLLCALGATAHECDVAGCVADFRSRYRDRCVDTKAQPGVVPMLEALARQVPCALATSKPREFASAIVAHLGLTPVFTCISAPEPDWPSDDKTAVLADGLRQMRAVLPHALPASRCLMVGDRRHDVEAARTLGMLALGVTWGVGSREELAAAAPDYLVDEPTEVIDVVLGLTEMTA